MNGIHRDLDTEFLELDFQQMPHSRQGLGGIIELLLLRRIKNRDRWQGAFDCAVNEQWSLLFLLHALAGLGRTRRCRSNDRRHMLFTLGHVLAEGHFTLDDPLAGLGLLTAIGRRRRDHVVDLHIDFTQLRDHLPALDTGSPPAVGGALEQLEQVQGDLAGHVHDLEPGQVGEHGQTKQEQRDEQQSAALDVQCLLGQVAQDFTQHTTGRARKACCEVKMDVRQRSTCQHQKHQTDQAPGEQPAAPLPGFVTMTEHLPGLDGQQQRKDIGEVTQHHEQDVGTERTGTPGSILHLRGAAGMAPARIALIVGQ